MSRQPTRWRQPVGRWTCVEREVVLNNGGRADGQLQVWIDGALAMKLKDVTFRASSGLHVDGILFSTFFGGSDQSYASPSDQHIDFADFAVDQQGGGCAGSQHEALEVR